MSKAINLALDTTKSDINNPTYKLRQGDGNYQTIRATITANGEPFDLTDVSVSFNGTTAANTKVIDYNVVKIDILQGLIEYTPNKQMGSSVGRYKEAYFRFTKGDSTATTASFNIDVTTSVDINNEDAKDYVSIVDTVVKNLNDTTEKQLAHSDEVINGHIDELSEKIESTTQDFNEKANKATSSVLKAQQIIDTKLSNVEKQIEEDVSSTNDRVKQLNDALDNIKADEPNYAKINSDNTFKGKNNFEQKIIAPNGLQGNADTARQSEYVNPKNNQIVNNLTVNGQLKVSGNQKVVSFSGTIPKFGFAIEGQRVGDTVRIHLGRHDTPDIGGWTGFDYFLPNGFKPAFDVSNVMWCDLQIAKLQIGQDGGMILLNRGIQHVTPGDSDFTIEFKTNDDFPE
ncbi:hypothetical protein FFRU_160060 [Fructobacillus fructosus]|uniref:BppU family phage baseplate upper protein n=1 Tax=Fructobacillus fructosus TaxID=1631 RepID=UPI0002194E7D|nr:BppU family phage baseplate upper protein [Fructobacillus fructosus]KRN52131.1 Phage infection protein [Fructobacillus fructosus KCTC 3544]GAP01912.1 hypothetical protein FFRU_160060 [Fructobacillus fructosus]